MAQAEGFMAVRTRPAPHPLWAVTLLVVGTFTVGRWLMAATLDLRTDEAYYWTWSHEWVLSYLDHPPMVAWFVRAGTAVFGDSAFGARFAHLLALPLIELLFADIARRRTGSMSAFLFVVLAFESTLNFGVTSAFIEPGIPLLLFAGLMFWALCRLDETADGRWWLAIGLFGGLALLSKLTAVFLMPAILAFVLVPARNRRWLASGWFWSAALLCLLVFMPVLIWNASNDWAMFRFQGVRAASSGGSDWRNLVTYVVTHIAFTGPVLTFLVVWGATAAAWRFRGGSDAIGLILAVAFLAPFAYLLERSTSLYVNPSWVIQIWPFGFTTLAIAIFGPSVRDRAWPMRLAVAAIATGLVIPAAMLFHATLDRSVWLANRDPIGADAGYDTAASEILEIARANGATFIATSDYRTYAVLRWHLRSTLPVVQVTERSRFIGFAVPDPAVLSGPGLYVYTGEAAPLVADTRTGRTQPLGPVQRTWRGQAMGPLNVDLFEGWTAPLRPDPDSPFYEWPNLT